MNGRRPFRVILVAAAVLLLAGCQLPGDNLPPPPVNQPTAAGAPADGAGSPVGGGLLHAGRGWTAAGIVGVFPPAGSCHLRFTPVGEPLPDPRCTPGVADQAVTQQNLPATVCREGGYTRTVRPPRAVTDAAKKKLLPPTAFPAPTPISTSWTICWIWRPAVRPRCRTFSRNRTS